MAPFIVLLIVFFASLGVIKLGAGEWNYLLSGNLAMCIMLFFTAFGHYKFSKGMEMMIPPFIPFKKFLVFITGIMEIGAGIALLFPAYRYYTGVFLIIFFMLLLPANIYAAAKHIDIQKGTFDGKGVSYLWFRIPFQLFLIAWVWYFSLHATI